MKTSSVLLTGASGGIGRALALAYAVPGTTLHLSGRDSARLAATAEACLARGATVHATPLDVRDAHATEAWIAQAEELAPLDLVLANAGIGAGLDENLDDWAETRTIIEVNLTGTINTIEPALARMRPRRRGKLVLMGSLAAIRGIPGSHGYSASKAALRALAEGLRAPLAAEGIRISLVSPGFVRTAMNEGKGFPTPMRIEPDRAAAIIQRGVARGRFHIAFPLPVLWGTRMLALLPPLADVLALRASRRR